MAVTRRVQTPPDQETYVVRDPKILDGEPTIRGTRVPVRSIVIGWRRYEGDGARVASAYNVDPAAVEAALAFYAANTEEVDRHIRENERLAIED